MASLVEMIGLMTHSMIGGERDRCKSTLDKQLELLKKLELIISDIQNGV